jgi:hypothetical protein
MRWLISTIMEWFWMRLSILALDYAHKTPWREGFEKQHDRWEPIGYRWKQKALRWKLWGENHLNRVTPRESAGNVAEGNEL